MVAESRGTKKVAVVIVIVIILALFILGIVFFGFRSILKVFIWMFVALFILAIIGLVVYLVWYLFIRKQKYDVTYVNKQKLIDACHKGFTGTMKGLYISGDKGHSRIYWGEITGYARISVLTRNMLLDDNGQPKKFLNQETGREEIQYDSAHEEQDV